MGRLAKRLAVGVFFTLLAAELTLQLAALASPLLFSRAEEPGPGAEVTVLCVGDSHTWGAPLPPKDSYPAQLRKALRERYGPGVEVVNLGVPGANSAMVANRLAGQIAHYSPDLVIVWGGINTLWNPSETSAWDDESTWPEWLFRSKLVRLAALTVYRATTPVHTRAKLVEWTKERTTFRMGDEEVVVRESKPSAGWQEKRAGLEHDYTRMIETARRFDVPIVFIAYPYDHEPAVRMVNDAARTVAFVHGVEVVDANDSLRRALADGYRPDDLIIDAAGPHPRAPLYRYVVQNLLPIVREELWSRDDCGDEAAESAEEVSPADGATGAARPRR